MPLTLPEEGCVGEHVVLAPVLGHVTPMCVQTSTVPFQVPRPMFTDVVFMPGMLTEWPGNV